MLSDFLDENYEEALRVAGKKHDLIGIKVYDKMDMQLPDAGLIEVEDAETGKMIWVDTSTILCCGTIISSPSFKMTELSKSIFLKSGSDLPSYATDEDYVKIVQKFFVGRNRPA